MRPAATDSGLWHQVQRIVYPRRFPSNHPPFERSECSPKRKPASWLYYTLLDNPEVRLNMRIF